MLVIGSHTDNSTGKRWYLLQNWWKQKQFVQVDEEYLKASEATVYFVETPQQGIPSDFPTTYARYVENENCIDKSETYALVETRGNK